MNVLFAALLKRVIDEGINLPAFADSRAVSVPVALAIPVRENDACRLAGVDHIFKLDVGDASLQDQLGRQMMAIGDIRRLYASHRGTFDNVRWMGNCAANDCLLDSVGSKDGSFFNVDRLRRYCRFELT